MKIQFYLNEILTDTLKSKGVEGESPHLTAKRLMEDLLKGEVVQNAIAAPSSDALAELSDRLDALEESQGCLDPDDLERLGKIISDQLGLKEIRDRVAVVEMALSVEGMQQRFNTLNDLLKAEIDPLGDRLSDLSTRLHQMELFLSDRPLPPTLPKKEIHQGLTHKEIAAMIGSSERTMQRVAKEKERWPEGYHWSEESKKWFPA